MQVTWGFVTCRLARAILALTPAMTSTADGIHGIRLDVGSGRGADRIPAILMVPPAALAPATTGAQANASALVHANATAHVQADATVLARSGAQPHRWPAVLLLHGLTSDKERMATSVGRALRALGVASLAIDLPLHGERRDRDAGFGSMNPLALAGAWRRAQKEAHRALEYLAERDDIAADRVGLVGYSMGSFLGLVVAAAADRVRAVVLAAGGDLPTGTPYDRAMRLIADPLQAVQRLGGRPLLMVHGRHDRTVSPAQAQRLFDAAREPKTLKWWDSGHYLPDAAIADASRWLAGTLSGASPGALPDRPAK
jgi:fermentation-respiration switch protein FrsA (DUF1100 family)